jgi:hypothetical protein
VIFCPATVRHEGSQIYPAAALFISREISTSFFLIKGYATGFFGQHKAKYSKLNFVYNNPGGERYMSKLCHKNSGPGKLRHADTKKLRT